MNLWTTLLNSTVGESRKSNIDYADLHPEDEEAYAHGSDWEGLLRGTLAGSIIQKMMSYITLADQKAQAAIILNSVIIPLALTGLNQPDFKVMSTFAVVAGVISIFGAIMCIYPKRREGAKPDGSPNFLHFGDIASLKESEYLTRFLPIYNDTRRLSREVVKDLHDMSRRILMPKFFWLKISYGTFFVLNLIGIIWTMAKMWFFPVFV